MAKKKKNRKAIANRKEQSKQKRKHKLKSRSINLPPLPSGSLHESLPAISDIGTPKGFRSISISQAMTEFSQPLLEYAESGAVAEINDKFQIGMALWNYLLPSEQIGAQQLKNNIIKQMQKTLKLSEIEAITFFNEMIERKAYLFPPDIQPQNPMILFIRKEGKYKIKPFDYSKLVYSESPITANLLDKKFIVSLNQMDKYIIEGAQYEEWESHFFRMQKQCRKRFQKWLKEKGIDDHYVQEFPYCIEIYLNFIYQYGHDVLIILKTITQYYLEEFFGDFLLRKVMAKPDEYALWPPAIKLFYQFLSEKGYLSKPEALVKLVDYNEAIFIEILKERY